MSIVIRFVAEQVNVVPRGQGTMTVAAETEPEQLGAVCGMQNDQDLETILNHIGVNQICRLLGLVERQ
jgi:hypothetical protein